MIFKKKPQLTINPDIVKSGDFPVLVKDAEWNRMTSGIRNRKMSQLIDEIKRQMADLEKTKKNLLTLKATKKKLTQEILTYSYLVNEGAENLEKLDRLEVERNHLKKASLELENEQRKLEEIPSKINKLNLELLEETANQVYVSLIEFDKKNKKIEEKVSHLRNELNLLREEKEMMEKQLESWYSFLHHLVGPHEMEKLDQQISFQPSAETKDMVK
jgi:DNA repair exonuclease SbcCD ATPase subunit